MFKTSIISLFVVAGLTACLARRAPTEAGAGSLKTVKINQPSLEKEMRSSIKEDEKKAVLDSLVYEIKIAPKLVDGKDDCDKDVTGTTFESGVKKLDESTFDSLKVKRGCDYVVSMTIGAKSDDGKSIKTIYLVSSDKQKPSILSRDELKNDNPVAKVSLYVTSEGKKYWDADEIVTPTDSDTTIEPSLSRKTLTFKKQEEVPKYKKGDTGQVTADVVLTPENAPSQDMYCGVAIRLRSNTDNKFSYFYKGGKIDTAIETVPEKSSAEIKISLSNDTFKEIPGDKFTQRLLTVCSTSEDGALDLLKKCVAPQSGTEAEGLKDCPTNAK